MTTRKNYSKAFKLDAVNLVTEQSYTRAEAARSLDINANMLGRWVKDIAMSSKYRYGSRRMKQALNAVGYPVSRNKARKLMREADVKAGQRKKFRVTTNSRCLIICWNVSLMYPKSIRFLRL